jgi:hypothetical protein
MPPILPAAVTPRGDTHFGALQGDRLYERARVLSPRTELTHPTGTLLPRAAPDQHPELRPHDLPAQNLELVAQHQQLDVFHNASPDGYAQARRGKLAPRG